MSAKYTQAFVLVDTFYRPASGFSDAPDSKSRSRLGHSIRLVGAKSAARTYESQYGLSVRPLVDSKTCSVGMTVTSESLNLNHRSGWSGSARW